MIETYTSIHIHLIWSTWDRLPILTADVEPDIHGLIVNECHRLRAFVAAIGGTDDHVHLLVGMPPTVTIADLAKQVKGASSYVVNRNLFGDRAFRWQGAYGAFSVSPPDVATVADYIRRQREHHATGRIIRSLEWHSDTNPTGGVAAPSERMRVPAEAGR